MSPDSLQVMLVALVAAHYANMLYEMHKVRRDIEELRKELIGVKLNCSKCFHHFINGG